MQTKIETLVNNAVSAIITINATSRYISAVFLPCILPVLQHGPSSIGSAINHQEQSRDMIVSDAEFSFQSISHQEALPQSRF